MIGRQALAQAIQALGDGLARKAGQRLGSLIHLDARNRAGGGDQVDQRRAVGGVLPDGLVIEDHTGHIAGHGLGGPEQHFAIVAAGLLGGLNANGVEPLLDGARGFVGRQYALARSHHGLGDPVQCCQIHRSALVVSPCAGRTARLPIAHTPTVLSQGRPGPNPAPPGGKEPTRPPAGSGPWSASARRTHSALPWSTAAGA